MAKKRQTDRNSRPRRPKRIISGITEFIDDNWWEDSQSSSRDKKRKFSDTASEDDSGSTTAKEKKKEASSSKNTRKKSAQTEKEPVAKKEPEPKLQPKRKRSRRRVKKSEPVATSEVEQETPVEKLAETAPKKKRRRRPSRQTTVEEKTTVKAKPDQASEQEESSSEKTTRRQRKPRPETKVEEVKQEEKRSRPKKQPKRTEVKVEKTPREESAAEPKQKRRRKKSQEEPCEERKQTTASKKKTFVKQETPAPTKTSSKKRPTKKRTRAHKATGFEAMDLSDEMHEALELAGYSEPTPIQAGLIPAAIKGNDLMGQAQTGTGKTAAFAIPLIEMIDYDAEFRGPQALILVPTRELAVQVRDECAKLAATGEVQVVAIYGGKPIRQQIEKLRRSPEIVVGTPGRVIDLCNRGALFFGDLRQVVLDEADRMLDIGFRPDIEKILRRCPQSRQTLLLSATLPGPVLRLAQRYMRDPESLDFSPKNIAVETIDQFYFTVDPERKFDLLLRLIKREDPAQAIVFCRTRRGTEKIYRRLSREKLESVACIHGDLPQSTRDSTMRRFRENKLRLLIATDVVGRGIDVTGVSHIINYDIPEFCDDYVHRVGRTGRMGREGVAYSFISSEEGPQLTRIEMRINILLKRAEMPGFDMGIKAVSDENEPPPESKPVYGRPKRRVRRAL